MSMHAGGTRKWRKVLLSANYEFVYCQNEEDKRFMAINIRESYVTSYAAFVRTTWQRLQEVLAYRSSKETGSSKITHEQLHSLWQARFEKSPSKLSEVISLKWIDTATRIWDKILHREEVRNKINDIEETFNKCSPLNSLSALEALVGKTNGEVPTILWVLDSMKDVLQQELLRYTDLSGRNLAGAGKAKGWLDVTAMKMQILRHLTGLLPQKGLSAVETQVLTDCVQSHSHWRAKCGGGRIKADVTWQSMHSEGFRKSLSFIGQVIFGVEYDDHLRSAVRATQDVGELLGQSPFSDLLEAISQELAGPVHTSSAEVVAPLLSARDSDKLGVEVTLESLDITPELAQALEEELRSWIQTCEEHKDCVDQVQGKGFQCLYGLSPEGQVLPVHRGRVHIHEPWCDSGRHRLGRQCRRGSTSCAAWHRRCLV